MAPDDRTTRELACCAAWQKKIWNSLIDFPKVVLTLAVFLQDSANKDVMQGAVPTGGMIGELEMMARDASFAAPWDCSIICGTNIKAVHLTYQQVCSSQELRACAHECMHAYVSCIDCLIVA